MPAPILDVSAVPHHTRVQVMVLAVAFLYGTAEVFADSAGSTLLPMIVRPDDLGIGNSREIILGEVVYAHFRADVVDRIKHYIDPVALDAVGRMGGHGYASTRDLYDLKTMSVDQWRGGEPARRQPIGSV